MDAYIDDAFIDDDLFGRNKLSLRDSKQVFIAVDDIVFFAYYQQRF